MTNHLSMAYTEINILTLHSFQAQFEATCFCHFDHFSLEKKREREEEYQTISKLLAAFPLCIQVLDIALFRALLISPKSLLAFPTTFAICVFHLSEEAMVTSRYFSFTPCGISEPSTTKEKFGTPHPNLRGYFCRIQFHAIAARPIA